LHARIQQQEQPELLSAARSSSHPGEPQGTAPPSPVIRHTPEVQSNVGASPVNGTNVRGGTAAPLIAPGGDNGALDPNKRLRLGVDITDVIPDVSSASPMVAGSPLTSAPPQRPEVTIVSVTPGSAAALAGLRTGDRVRTVDGVRCATSEQFVRLLQRFEARCRAAAAAVAPAGGSVGGGTAAIDQPVMLAISAVAPGQPTAAERHLVLRLIFT
jgi:hypothetical protein